MDNTNRNDRNGISYLNIELGESQRSNNNNSSLPSSNETNNSQDIIIDPKEKTIIINSNHDDKSTPIDNQFSLDNTSIKKIRVKRKTGRFCWRKIGNSFALLSDSESNPLFIVGPDWPIYLSFTSFVAFIMTLIYIYQGKKNNQIIHILGITFFCFFTISYTLTFLINQGYPKNTIERYTGKPQQDYIYCNRCCFYIQKAKQVVHCEYCNICVEGYDHHCPWTSKCIGKGNLIAFNCFLGSIVALFIFLIIILLLSTQ